MIRKQLPESDKKALPSTRTGRDDTLVVRRCDRRGRRNVGRWVHRGDGWECHADGHWLTTDRLVLRPLTPDDEGALLEVWGPEVRALQGYSDDPKWLADFVRKCRGAPLLDGQTFAWQWAICDRSSGEMIGDHQVVAYKGMMACRTGGNLKFGWWDKGYGSEGLLAVVRLVAHHLGYSVIVAQTGPDNARARHVYEKCGFEMVGTQKDYELPNGTLIDAVTLRRVQKAERTCPVRTKTGTA